MSSRTPPGTPDGPTHRDAPRTELYRDAADPWAPLRRWESLAERLIREAQERGEFDDLPGHGRPLPGDTNPYAGDMALPYSILRNANVAPPWIEADKEVRRLLAERDALLGRARRSALLRNALRRRLAELVDEHNRAVERVNIEAPTARQQRRMLVAGVELAAFDRACREFDELSLPGGNSRAHQSGPNRAGDMPAGGAGRKESPR